MDFLLAQGTDVANPQNNFWLATGSGLLSVLVLIGGTFFVWRDRVIGSLNTEIDRLKKNQDELDQKLARAETRHEAAEEKCREKLHALERENDNLSQRLAAIEAANGEIPLATWEMDGATPDARYVAVSRRYVTLVLDPMGKSAGDILGKTHGQFWGNGLAGELERLDRAAAKSPTRQAMAHGLKFNAELGPCTVVKAVRIFAGRPVSMYGLIVPERDALPSPSVGTG